MLKQIKSKYYIFNPTTNYTIFQGDDLKLAKEFFYKIYRRKNSQIWLMDNQTGEILKIKKSFSELATS